MFAKITSNGDLSSWEKGFITHAFGDAFAHTYIDTGFADPYVGIIPDDNRGQEVAYGYPVGHTFDSVTGSNPDFIANGQGKYADYVNRLYSTLAGPNANRSKVSALLNAVQKIPASSSGENEFMFNYAVDNANYLEASESYYTPGLGNDIGQNILPSWTGFAIPTPGQLDTLLNKIKSHCCTNTK